MGHHRLLISTFESTSHMATHCCGNLIASRPSSAGAEGFVRLYRLIDSGKRLELVHKTAVSGIPGALAAFKGRLLAGVGPIVRLYDLGKKKLLRKSEYRRWVW